MQNVAERIAEIVRDNFPNGIRDDFIDANKILRIYAAKYADENLSPSTVVEVVRANGIEIGGRFHFISEKDTEHILLAFDALFEKYSIVYYSAVYEKHTDFFTRVHIFSADFLKTFWPRIDASRFYFNEFCAVSKMARLDREVSTAFTTADGSLSLEALQEKLPYVPAEKIAAVLSDKKKFLPTVTGNYIPASKIKFDFDEIIAAKEQIFSSIDAKGCAAPEDYSLASNFALNPEIPEKVLGNVIYEKFFAIDFTKHEDKLFLKGHVVKKKQRGDSTQGLRNFVAAQEELSADELIASAKKFKLAPSVGLSVAYESMIRVSKDLFVKDNRITFDVAAIDEALTPFVQGKIIPLRAVTSFTGFAPVEGYSWNLFLLESFLRKYSRRYTYAAPDANSASVGAIYPKSMKFKDYREVQASAVVQDDVPLEKSAVEKFLVGQGYRKNRIDKVIADIIIRAQEMLRR